MPTGYPLKVNEGDRYGRLTIIREDKKKEKSRWFLCKCDCGDEKSLRLNDLRRGSIKSCGCLLRETSAARKIKHGACETRLYSIWAHMKQRCLNEDNQDYKYYGGRGIIVCKEWMDFQSFNVWAIENGYDDSLTIDRIDNNGNYEPSNCRWSSREDQVNNTRKTINICYEGKTKSLKQWSKILGMKYTTLYRRLSKGWSVDEAFTSPSNKTKGGNLIE
jgi:hypothetical protein